MPVGTADSPQKRLGPKPAAPQRQRPAAPSRPSERTRRPPSDVLPRFKDGLQYIEFIDGLSQEGFVWEFIIQVLDQFVDPDIGEPKRMKCGGKLGREFVEQRVIINVQEKIRSLLAEHDKVFKAATRLPPR